VADGIRLLFLAGSTREASLNRKLAAYGCRLAGEAGLAAEVLELSEYPMPLYNGDLQARDGIPDSVYRLNAAFERADGVFIASPEYNASVTPLLKNSLDWLSRIREEGRPPLALFKTRVFAIGSASGSLHGGVRGLIALRQVLAVGLGALVLPEQIAVPRAADAFDGEGRLVDEAMRNSLTGLVRRLGFVAERLKG
jgi:chromate reductase